MKPAMQQMRPCATNGESDRPPSSAEPQPPGEMIGRVAEATALLKALAHEGRMMILCHLAEGERTVTDLELLLDQRQAAVSQQLARLRAEGLVSCRRDGKLRLYRVADPRAAELVGLMHRLFCAD